MPRKICGCCFGIYICEKSKINRSRFCSRKCLTQYIRKEQYIKILDKQDEETAENTKELMQKSFEKFFEKTEGCWIWIGAKKDKMPYGDFIFRNKKWIAHRASYHIYKGTIIKGLLVLHSCDNPSCVNPDHLRLGTHVDNLRDKVERGRHKVEKLSIEQVKEIKILIEQGESCRSIAKKYLVSAVNVGNIKNKKIWTWI